MITYDHTSLLVQYFDTRFKYAFKWIGYDGKEKTVIFQRGDILDVVVSASVIKSSNQQYVYSYELRNLPSSATYLKRFLVQNFASDTKPTEGGAFLALAVSNAIYQFREGRWLAFSDVSDHVQINPGQTVTVQLTSSAPPGSSSAAPALKPQCRGLMRRCPRRWKICYLDMKSFPKVTPLVP